jgi:hypothetical protein
MSNQAITMSTPTTLHHACAYYQALTLAADAMGAVANWSVAKGADAIEDWTDALFGLSNDVVAAAIAMKADTPEALEAKRTILMDRHERCGDPTVERLQTLASLAAEEAELELAQLRRAA